MLKHSSELIQSFIEYESKVLAEDNDMPHMPTIGDGYESITKNMLSHDYILPPEFDLRVVSGFIRVQGKLVEQQIDCMLVVGEGRRYGLTEQYFYEIENVLCVFEVKKTLRKSDLSDALEHLSAIRKAFTNEFERRVKEEGYIPDIFSARKHFAQITGRETINDYRKINDLPPEDGMLLYSLVQEMHAPVTIIHGYGGYKTESGIRNAFGDILQEKFDSGNYSFGVLSLPSVITSNDFSLVKTGGLPFVVTNGNSEWVSIVSTRFNPAEIILEVVWSKISSFFGCSMPWDDDIYMNNLSPLMIAVPRCEGDKCGWMYKTIDYDELSLSRQDDHQWMPEKLDSIQMSIIRIMSMYGEFKVDKENIEYFKNKYDANLKLIIDSLIDTRIFMRKGDVVKPISNSTLIITNNDGTGYVSNERERMDSWCERNAIRPTYMNLIIM